MHGMLLFTVVVYAFACVFVGAYITLMHHFHPDAPDQRTRSERRD